MGSGAGDGDNAVGVRRAAEVPSGGYASRLSAIRGGKRHRLRRLGGRPGERSGTAPTARHACSGPAWPVWCASFVGPPHTSAARAVSRGGGRGEVGLCVTPACAGVVRKRDPDPGDGSPPSFRSLRVHSAVPERFTAGVVNRGGARSRVSRLVLELGHPAQRAEERRSAPHSIREVHIQETG